MQGIGSHSEPPHALQSVQYSLVLLTALLSACAKSEPVPEWFDAVQRAPIQTVLVDNHRIAYLDNGDGPPVILVHGLGGSMWQWEYQHFALAQTHRVITLDMLGSGLSDKPDIEYRPDQLVDFFNKFMDALSIRRSALVGNSLGAGLAIGMALSHPERVDRLILIGGLPGGIRTKLKAPLVKRAVETRAPVWLATLGNWLGGRGLTEAVLRETVHDPGLLTPLVIERSYQNRKMPGLIPPLLALTRNLDLWEQGFALRLSEISQPTLLIWGAEDQIFPVEVGRELEGTIPNSSLVVVPDTGHMPQWEQPETVNPIIQRFLQS